MKTNQTSQSFTQAWNTYIESCGSSPEEHGYKYITNWKGNFLYATNQNTGNAVIIHQKFISTCVLVFSISTILIGFLSLLMLFFGYFPIFAFIVSMISIIFTIFCLFAKRYCKKLEKKFRGKVCVIYKK